jgi:hypothetical protein
VADVNDVDLVVGKVTVFSLVHTLKALLNIVVAALIVAGNVNISKLLHEDTIPEKFVHNDILVGIVIDSSEEQEENAFCIEVTAFNVDGSTIDFKLTQLENALARVVHAFKLVGNIRDVKLKQTENAFSNVVQLFWAEFIVID